MDQCLFNIGPEFNVDDLIISDMNTPSFDLICHEVDVPIAPPSKTRQIQNKIALAKKKRADCYEERKNLRFKSNDLTLKILELTNQMSELRAEYYAALRERRNK